MMSRQFSGNEKQQETEVTVIANSNRKDEDQMLIDETIDLVGSDDNVNRLDSKECVAIQPQPVTNATFDISRKDGTFIKSPTKVPITGPSVFHDSQKQTTKLISKSRDSLNVIGKFNQHFNN